MGTGKTEDINRQVQAPKSRIKETKVAEEELIESIESANEQLIAYNRRFEFSIHEKTKHIMVKIIDITTDEIIREIPPEKILDIVAGLWELSGLLVDERI
ncbi:MAG TPA: flagellar protein FlaG [Tepidimicrobium sp.]|nr:flagellar protein FlaG [Tepidimicrobium sp.]